MGIFQINRFTEKYSRDKVSVADVIPYEIATGFSRAEDLIYWSLFCEMQKQGYTRPITCLGDVEISHLYAIKKNCIQLAPKVSLDITNHLFSSPLYPMEIDQYYEFMYLPVYRENAPAYLSPAFSRCQKPHRICQKPSDRHSRPDPPDTNPGDCRQGIGQRYPGSQ